MKKATFLLLCLLLAATAFSGEITKTYHFSNANVKSTDAYQMISFAECMNTGYTGEPSMPWYAVKLLLPPGEKAVSFSVEVRNEQQIPGSFLLYPQQASRPISHGGSGTFSMNNEVYSSAQSYPDSPFGIINTEYMNGYGIAMMNICPLRYIPAKGECSFYSEITVTIKTESTRESEAAINMISSTDKVLDRVQSFVQNPEVISSYPVKENRSDDYQLLIITPQQFENDFEDLIALYLSRGLKTEIATTEDIAGSMSGQDLQEQIRNYIIQEYTSYNVEFVLLGGDVEYVPYRGFYCYVQSGSGYQDSDIPADLYYSGLDGTWNDNNDNLWGEIGEDDLLPDIAVGRYSFSSIQQLNAMKHKTIKYQDEPILGELAQPLFAGEHLWSDPLTYGSDYINLLRGYQDENGYITIGIPPTQDIDSLYEKDQNWGGSTIMAEINTGKSFVHHCGHANSSTVMHLNSSDITNANFSEVNGVIHNYSFVQSHGCICGAFDNSDCIMEHMVYIENFAAAVIGNSRYGWFNEGQTEGPSGHLHREMVDALYEEEIGRIGAAFVESKIQTAPWVNAPGQHEEGALRWNFYDINILGDPTLQLFTDEPFIVNALFSAPILMGAASMDVSVFNSGTPVEGMMCALTKDGILHGTAITDANGDATIIMDPLITTLGNAELTISGYNCLTVSYNIVVSPAGGPFMVYSQHILDDNAGGNGNGMADYGESIFMTVDLTNAGTADATNVTATLGADDEYITITDALGIYGSVPSGTTSGTINDYAFDVGALVPDQHIVEFSLSIAGDGKEQWADGFNITLNAPVLETGSSMSINDDVGGNGDGFLDPGETAIITFGILNNGHSTAFNTMVSCSTFSQYVSPDHDVVSIGDMEAGMNQDAEFQITVDEDTPLGTSVCFYIMVESGEYVEQDDYCTQVGILVEDWESAGFERFNWQFAADAPWEMCTVEPWEGTYCSRSGDVGDSQNSELFVTLEVLSDGDLSFYRKLSSEAEWDFLRFYIDYTMMGEWSGELDWEMVSFPVEEGLHTFRWVYEKDGYESIGEDCAWVDFIVFPAVDIATSIDQPSAENDIKISLRPNPAKSTLYIDYETELVGGVQLSIYDIRGQEVKQLKELTDEQAGHHQMQVDVSGLEAGIYLCKLITGEMITTRKLVIAR